MRIAVQIQNTVRKAGNPETRDQRLRNGEVPYDKRPQEAYEQRTGYQLPEGHHYVLDTWLCDITGRRFSKGGGRPAGVPAARDPGKERAENRLSAAGRSSLCVGCKQLCDILEDGSPKVEADQPEVPQQKPRKHIEQRTGYQLPEGYHYVLDANGYVILLENGSPQIALMHFLPSTNEELVADQQI